MSGKLEAKFLNGSYRMEVQGTFEKARPILDQLEAQHPSINRDYVLYLLRQQTLIAAKWQNRRLHGAWRNLCKAYDEFRKEATATPTFTVLKRTIERAKRVERKKTTLGRALEDFWERPWPKQLREEFPRLFSLPLPQLMISEGKRGRPSSWWSDGVARSMKEHFEEHTGKPRWTVIGKLLSCAPRIQFLMEGQHIRQRLVRWRREEKAPEQHIAYLYDLVYGLNRGYKEGRDII